MTTSPAGRSARPAATVTLGLLTGPGLPEELARELTAELPPLLAERVGDEVRWAVRLLADPVATEAGRGAIELIDAARARMLRQGWDLAVVLTDLPLRVGRRPVVADASATHGVGIVSLPALGPRGLRRRAGDALEELRVAASSSNAWLGGPKRKLERGLQLPSRRSRSATNGTSMKGCAPPRLHASDLSAGARTVRGMLQESARDLHELLEQAASLAARLGEQPAALPVDQRPSFLIAQGDNDPQPIIERIATAERSTFVVGAGASMEAGLLSWASLVRDVLAAVAPTDLADGDRAAWLSAVEESGRLGMAATARALAGSDADFMQLVDHHVCRGKGAEHFEPGPLAREIALGIAAQAVEDGDPQPDDVAVVRHLHGKLSPQTSRSSSPRATTRCGRPEAGRTASWPPRSKACASSSDCHSPTRTCCGGSTAPAAPTTSPC